MGKEEGAGSTHRPQAEPTSQLLPLPHPAPAQATGAKAHQGVGPMGAQALAVLGMSLCEGH